MMNSSTTTAVAVATTNNNNSGTTDDVTTAASTRDATPHQARLPKKKNAWGKPAGFKKDYDHDEEASNTTLTMAQIMAQQENERERLKQHTPQNENEEERMIRLAMELSLAEEEHQRNSTTTMSAAAKTSTTDDMKESDDDRQLRLAMEESLRMAESIKKEDEAITLAMVSAAEYALAGPATATATATSSPSPTVAAAASAAARGTEASTADQILNKEEKEELDRVLKEIAQKEKEEEEASLQLALKLQSEEDAALASREHRVGNNNGNEISASTYSHVGVRTMTQADFHKLKGGGSSTSEHSSYKHSSKINPAEYSNYYADTDDTYYYDDDEGYRLNSKAFRREGGISSEESPQRASKWIRSGQNSNTIVGGKDGQEIRTKHDVQLKNISNARRMGLTPNDAGGISGVSDRAYNSLKNKTSKQTQKGVALSGTGRAENLNYDRTRQGAIDGVTLREIQRLVNDQIIGKMNGAVKEGKEALVYHADGPTTNIITDSSSSNNDIAIKIFKRIQEFKLRSKYVDGDPRYKTKFNQNNKRTQVEVWCEKEFRNLLRAHRNNIPTPKPLMYKQNLLLMSFLGEDGWPSPQLREIKLRYKSSKWNHLYCEAMMLVRKLVQCARLIHGDLSEYNILLVPSYLLDAANENNTEETQLALIDFGQAVTVGHPNAMELLERDLMRLSTFFANQGGVSVLPLEEIKQYVLEEPLTSAESYINNDDDENENDLVIIQEGDESENENDETTTSANETWEKVVVSPNNNDDDQNKKEGTSSSSSSSLSFVKVLDTEEEEEEEKEPSVKKTPRCDLIRWDDDVEYNKLMTKLTAIAD